MWIRKTPNGKFQFGENYKDPLTGKWRRVTMSNVKNTAHTRKMAQIELERRITEKLKHADDGKLKQGVTLGELREEWLPVYKERVKYHTYINNESRSKAIVEGLGEDILLTRIKPILLVNWLEKLLYEEDYKNSSVQKFKGTMSNMFRYAVKQNYMGSNPAIKAEVSYKNKDEAEKPEAKFLDDDELKKVLDYMYKRSLHYGRFCEFLYLTGMRAGEAASLYPKDIVKDGDKTVAKVYGTLVIDKHPYKQMSPKTADSRRNVSLTPEAVKLVDDEMRTPHKTDFIFASPRGNAISLVSLNHYLKEAKGKYDIHKKISLHTFRHTHISKLAELGIPLYLIQQRVGHKDAKTTEMIYLHVTKKAEQQLDEKLKFL